MGAIILIIIPVKYFTLRASVNYSLGIRWSNLWVAGVGVSEEPMLYPWEHPGHMPNNSCKHPIPATHWFMINNHIRARMINVQEIQDAALRFIVSRDRSSNKELNLPNIRSNLMKRVILFTLWYATMDPIINSIYVLYKIYMIQVIYDWYIKV